MRCLFLLRGLNNSPGSLVPESLLDFLLFDYEPSIIQMLGRLYTSGCARHSVIASFSLFRYSLRHTSWMLKIFTESLIFFMFFQFLFQNGWTLCLKMFSFFWAWKMELETVKKSKFVWLPQCFLISGNQIIVYYSQFFLSV